MAGSRKVPVYGRRAGDLALGTSEAWPVQALLWLREDSPELGGEGPSMRPIQQKKLGRWHGCLL